ncbi:zf-HC2 domain-containing protein [Microbacterium sp. EST19A]|uniref:zf-HC2 domain-containing protein n=1 Tax=Microbacterium sp. EST19A TaxID=2862681 RepID=UPI001CBD5067|nr:zf-HC2 domain-containing protein [Microbacterium sp. EST19A]
MNADHARYNEWDAAYVLGALSAADRAEYEAHLSQCPECRAALGEVAPTLGLLSRVAPERAESLLRTADAETPTPETPGPEHRARVLSLAAARARRRRRAWVAGIAAAAAIVVAAVAVPIVSAQLRPPSTTIALDQVVDAPLTATVDLTDVAWGTKIDMACDYGSEGDAPANGWAYALVVVSDDGVESVLSTWRAHPGTTARLSAGTDLSASEIAAVEIRSVDSGNVLMRSSVDVS